MAWFDRKTGHVQIKDERFRDAALSALARHLPSPAPTSPPPPAHDLALRRPGQALRDKVQREGPGLVGRTVAWILRRPPSPWQLGLRGERVVGRELARLSRRGWSALHSIPLSPTWDIDHLLIGPGGVFSINTKNHHGRSVWVGDHSVRVDHGPGRPYVRNSRREAAVVQKVLERGCGFPVVVNPLLVFVRPARLDTVASLTDVQALEDRGLAGFTSLPGVLRPDQVADLYAVARDHRSWPADR
ncbi:nuclease-related domain-containing protein [Streptomyces sp. NPDC047014]|uniref:nuclease-related domain-containing protein n=1 Tax=Streptomyces sp. NPDC047014 TaxID=3155736 RepID=UPI0033E553C2